MVVRKWPDAIIIRHPVDLFFEVKLGIIEDDS